MKRTQTPQETGRMRAVVVLDQRQRQYKKESLKMGTPLECGKINQVKQKKQKKRRKRVDSYSRMTDP